MKLVRNGKVKNTDFLFFSLSTKSFQEYGWNEILTLPGLGLGVGLSLILVVICMVTWCNLLDLRFELRRGFHRLHAVVVDNVVQRNVVVADLPADVDHEDHIGEDVAQIRLGDDVSNSSPFLKI